MVDGQCQTARHVTMASMVITKAPNVKLQTAKRSANTGNNVTTYFQSGANRINVFLRFGSRFLDNGSTYFEKVYSF